MGENEIFEAGLKFGADGLLHTAVPQKASAPAGRKELHTDDMYKDAYVCLTCPLEDCEGERECFVRRKKELEGKKR